MNVEGLERLRQEAKNQWRELHSKPLLTIGTATCGRGAGALETLETIRRFVADRNIECGVVEVGCIGLCYAEPIMSISLPGMPIVFYGEVTPKRAGEIVEQHLLLGKPVAKYAIGAVGDGEIKGIPNLFETPMMRKQVRLVLSRCGFIEPANLMHYLANGGFDGLQRALNMERMQIIDELRRSGLRGRGGAGFPTWRKWLVCIQTPSEEKFVICNSDEGDPGAFMNRSLIEGDPYSVLEGLLIAGYTIGAAEGFIYCRAEYPLALSRLREAIAELERVGLLGDNILGSDFCFRIRVVEGAGAFVCGEETALIASIEGKRGMPRTRPPFPAVKGLWGKPTVINNVETLAWVSHILRHGAEWFAKHGTEGSKGTKTFSLAGKVKRTGLIEVPLGATLREIVYDIGGGSASGREIKAVQIGGPSGGCIPVDLFDLPVDYESLTSAGAIMGSGGIVVMDEDTCMVDVAHYFLQFTQRESCGKCVPCRLGTKQMLTILEDITHGRGKSEDIQLLEELASAVKVGSLCGLGQTAPNPVLTTVRYFRGEYEAHIKDRRCPAGVCVPLLRFEVDEGKCTKCGRCARVCPVGAIAWERGSFPIIDRSKCIKCRACIIECPEHAIN
ncbi:MAG: NADH-ubiquinone oxidoreductase-F iron-sulfur binding region domain-containing protein [Armatimonadota bacterium]|nr:4Fe-4S binding protein [Armatimonadota bacterium]MCX7777167.1 4Fe-4S binding protein [Armatimonadota bacterium]MDW8024994.1 NADH-ubiquinone oxidoreductase-F iron-sulfur binding region domain-containing protein [Armatimonadota bacterium]